MSLDAPLSVPNQILFLSSAAQKTVLLIIPSETVKESHCSCWKIINTYPIISTDKHLFFATAIE